MIEGSSGLDTKRHEVNSLIPDQEHVEFNINTHLLHLLSWFHEVGMRASGSWNDDNAVIP